MHMDDEEMAYLKVLMDVFGRDSQICWERSSVAGLGPVNVTEYILAYAKSLFEKEKVV